MSLDPNTSNESKRVIHIKPLRVYLGIGASQAKNPNKRHGYTEIHP